MKVGINDQIRKETIHKNVGDEAKEKLNKSDQKGKQTIYENFDESKEKLKRKEASIQRKYKKMSLQSKYKHIKITGIAQKSYIALCSLWSLKKKDKLKLI